MDYDIVIVGLGTSGATLARLLNQEFKVLALDKADVGNTDSFNQSYNGLLTKKALRSLLRSDLDISVNILNEPAIFGVKTFDLQKNTTHNNRHTYINIDRHKFNLWLKSLIPKHIEVKNNALCHKIERIINGYQVTYVKEGQATLVTTQYVVGADGANSMVRHMRYPNHKIEQYIAIQQWFEKKYPFPIFSHIFYNGHTNCHAWNPTCGDFILGGIFSEKNAEQKFEQLKRAFENKGLDFGLPIKIEKGNVICPKRWQDFHVGNEQIFLIGEAAGFINPMSLEGINYGLDSATILSQIFNHKLRNPNKAYYQRTLILRLKILAKIIKSKLFSIAILRKIAIKSHVSNIKHIKK